MNTCAKLYDNFIIVIGALTTTSRGNVEQLGPQIRDDVTDCLGKEGKKSLLG